MKPELKDWSESASRALEREREKMMERVELIDGMARAMEAVDDILAENERLKAENESLNAENESYYLRLKHERDDARAAYLRYIAEAG